MVEFTGIFIANTTKRGHRLTVKSHPVFLYERVMEIRKYLHIKNAVVIIYVALFLLLAFYINLKPKWMMDKLNEWKLLPQPETLTELYFTDHLNLPISIAPNQKRYFEFTIHNMEEKDMTYTYEVYANIGDGSDEDTTESSESSESTPSDNDESADVFIPEKILIEEGEIKTASDQYKTVGITFELPMVKARNQVVVNLINKNQSIHFWVRGE
ncbi:hypothetical protein C4561_00230 [candidate division WWE3 bacterium]|jgi:hypothetical protein|uniref:DUF1616 domain-containing protein n=1 Tax=candidate division WWE3 bacterium TaxID=2053526 RepID=A0A3A4ZGK1_UNCKA|nr:MAG: hypothetical protein C4561_00230 [candidate division WWE3 bacterium]